MTGEGPLIIRGRGDEVEQVGELRRGAIFVPGLVKDLVLAPPAHGSWRLFHLQHPHAEWAVTDDVFHALTIRPELIGASVSVLQPGGVFAVVPRHGPRQLNETMTLSAPYGTLQESTQTTLQQAATWVDVALANEASAIVERGRPVRLLLSGGVDSGLLASHLVQAGADLTCVTIRTPWGDEIDGASRTAEHVGARLDIVDVTADEIVAALTRCMRLLQTSDAESVAIHVLVTMALEMGQPADLVTGLGSDLLNASGDVGMASASSDLLERLVAVSGSGLMCTAEHRKGARLFHPYWTPASIMTQLSVPRSLKSKDGIDKYYLRELAFRRLPAETAYGRKVAIHQGSGLVPGIEAHLSESLQAYCSRAWDRLTEELAISLERSA